ncbi:MAG: hypothetical protein Q4E64_04900 [Phascolarctobacterium sp.]|uniref:hypothetical protein n=1 Tax=Phascolarctobacterium sp. TaxID=2049039 RepID=UPI0026DC2789|nr:hypothetical protein [Phascolarctobacterium sp.]MDO4921148.1 hypothetical protein [Phascolarctobacterium sp.]
MKLKNLLAAVAAVAMCVLPLPVWARQPIEAGRTDCGVLYIEPDSVDTVKKDGKYYLVLMAEERYTDEQFLKILRQGEQTAKAASMLYLYMFNTYGSEYCIGASYLLDDEGRVCADLGSRLEPQAVGGNKTLQNAYTLALKILERKSQSASNG